MGTVVAVGPNEDSVPEADADVSSDSESVRKPFKEHVSMDPARSVPMSPLP